MRCNAGINPIYLADQHLIAEQGELMIVIGTLKKNNFINKTPIPPKFKLGTGHITFWYDKLLYLQKRLDALKHEVACRGFKIMDREIELDGVPKKFINDWTPTLEDSKIVRERIVEKMKAKPLGFWRYYSSKIIENSDSFYENLLNKKLFTV
jgi:deoxyribonuclease (pyrimidine dimer)